MNRQAYQPLFYSIFLLVIAVTLAFPSYAKVFIVDSHGKKIALRERELPPRSDECQFCHTRKQKEFIGKKTKTNMEHERIHARHGRIDLACHHCHDANNHDFLRSSPALPVDFKNTSGVCQRCHADRYRDWIEGAHGKRSGSWKDGQIQFHCIDCHDAHSVAFKTMNAESVVKKPRFLIEKHEHENGEAPHHGKH